MRTAVLAIVILASVYAFAQSDSRDPNNGGPANGQPIVPPGTVYAEPYNGADYIPDLSYTYKFRGIVTGTDRNLQDIMLTHENKKGVKTKQFVGRLRGTCHLPTGQHSARVLRAEDIPVGAELEAYYAPTRPRVRGNNTQTNEVYRITLQKLGGKPVANHIYRTAYCR